MEHSEKNNTRLVQEGAVVGDEEDGVLVPFEILLQPEHRLQVQVVRRLCVCGRGLGGVMKNGLSYQLLVGFGHRRDEQDGVIRCVRRLIYIRYIRTSSSMRRSGSMKSAEASATRMRQPPERAEMGIAYGCVCLFGGVDEWICHTSFSMNTSNHQSKAFVSTNHPMSLHHTCISFENCSPFRIPAARASAEVDPMMASRP